MIISCNNRNIMSKTLKLLSKRILFSPIFSYRHSSVRNNLKLSTNGRAKTIVGNINNSSFIIGEAILSIISTDSSSKENPY